ncbi:hypothetical protein [Rhizobium sp. MHM7A]|uniref:hypothetical protein n=1 Tax=Rhizobium sp. MHM7A TaxID=2583233 RepID=UPI001106E828|nr:hypothetical protein [Rhizobium sp. MHM7A]TLX16322.1 hypothetical protein FFR93_03050 [Rhizobium sp. MHM7A]
MRNFSFTLALFFGCSTSQVFSAEKFFDEVVFDFINKTVVEKYPVPENFDINKVSVQSYEILSMNIIYSDNPSYSKKDDRVIDHKTIENCSADPFEDKIDITEVSSIEVVKRSLRFYQQTAKLTNSVTIKGDGGFKAGAAGGWNATISGEFSQTFSDEVINRSEEEITETKKTEVTKKIQKTVVIPKHTVRTYKVIEPRGAYDIDSSSRILIDAKVKVSFKPTKAFADKAKALKASVSMPPKIFKLSDFQTNPSDRIVHFADSFIYLPSPATKVSIRDEKYEDFCK